MNRKPVQSVIREFEMDGTFDTNAFVEAVIAARDEVKAEQWPRGVQVS